MPYLPLAESDEEENNPDVPPLISENSDNEEIHPQVCPITPVNIDQEKETAITLAFHHTVPPWLWGVKLKSPSKDLGGFLVKLSALFLITGTRKCIPSDLLTAKKKCGRRMMPQQKPKLLLLLLESVGLIHQEILWGCPLQLNCG